MIKCLLHQEDAWKFPHATSYYGSTNYVEAANAASWDAGTKVLRPNPWYRKRLRELGRPDEPKLAPVYAVYWVIFRCNVHVYSNPKRDARKHTISIVFIAQAQGKPIADDDAMNLGIFSLWEIPQNLCFDHGQILEDYKRYRYYNRRPLPESC